MRRLLISFVVGYVVLCGGLVAPAAEAATAHGAVVAVAKATAKGVAKTPGWSWKGVKWLVRHA